MLGNVRANVLLLRLGHGRPKYTQHGNFNLMWEGVTGETQRQRLTTAMTEKEVNQDKTILALPANPTSADQLPTVTKYIYLL